MTTLVDTTVRSAVFNRQKSGGVHTVIDESITTGNIFYVDSGQSVTGGTSTKFGRNPDAPFTTLVSALAACTASNGDMIFLMPGHAEAPATSITVNKIGVTIIGLGNGTNRPTFTPTYVGAGVDAFDITVASVTIRGINIISGTCGSGAIINVNVAAGGHDFTMENCKIQMGAKNLTCFTVAATAHRGTLRDLTIVGTAANPNSIIILEGGSDDWLIERIDGIFTAATDIDSPVFYQNAVLMENLIMRDIRIIPLKSDGEFLAFNSNSVGIVERFTGYFLGNTVSDAFTIGSLTLYECVVGDAAQKATAFSPATLAV